MASYRDRVRAKAEAGIAPRPKVERPIVEPTVTPVADAGTPAKVTTDEAGKALAAPIDNAKAEITTPVQGGTSPVQGQGQVQAVNTIPLRQTLENQGIKVDWNPETGQVTANGMLVDTSRMSLANGRYSASYEDINNIMQQVQGQQQPMQPQGPVGQYQQQVEQGQQEKQDIMGKYSEQVAGITEEFQNRQPLYTEDIQQSLRQAFGDPFEYDPNKDPSLQEAQKYAEREIVNAMNARGILNSSITRDEYASMLSSMIPKYESIAYDRYQTNINNQLKKVNVLRSLSQDDYRMYKDQVDFTLNNLQNVTNNAINMIDDNLKTMYETTIELPLKLQETQAIERKNELDEAYDRLDMIGYVDNEIASITGIPAGTLTKDAKKMLGNMILSEEEKEKLVNGEIDMASLEYKAKQEELLAAKEEVAIKTEVQNYFAKMSDVLSQMSGSQAINEFSKMRDKLSEDLGEYYMYIADDVNTLRDDLVKRREDESKIAITRERETRLAKEAKARATKEETEPKISSAVRTKLMNEIERVVDTYKYKTVTDPDTMEEKKVPTEMYLNPRVRQELLQKVTPMLLQLDEPDAEALMDLYDLDPEEQMPANNIDPLRRFK